MMSSIRLTLDDEEIRQLLCLVLNWQALKQNNKQNKSLEDWADEKEIANCQYRLRAALDREYNRNNTVMTHARAE